MRPITFVVCLVLLGAAAGRCAGLHAEALWPSYRHDGGLTGCSPLAGSLASVPDVAWVVDLGAAVVDSERAHIEDLNGDGDDELLRILPDRLICQSIAGKKLWETDGLVKPDVVRLLDFAGNGTRGIVIAENTGTERRSWMVSGATGKKTLLYTMKNVFGAYSRLGKILPQVPGIQICTWWSGDPVRAFGGNSMRGAGYVWSFERGVDRPTVRFEAHEVGTIYAPLHLFADMDNDGKTDMVMITHEEFWVYDLDTGAKKMVSSLPHRIRSYWCAAAAMPLKVGRRPSFLMINPHQPGPKVVTQDGTKVHLKWKVVIGGKEDQYQHDVTVAAGAPDPFIDLDRDGEIEMMVAVTNEHGDGRTCLVVFGADRGVRRFEQAGLTMLAADDLDGDGIPEVLLNVGQCAPRKADGNAAAVRPKEPLLRIANWNGKQFVTRWEAEGVRPMFVPAPLAGDLTRAVGARVTRKNPSVWRLREGSNTFLLMFGSQVYACRLAPGGTLTRLGAVERHAALGNDRDPPKKTYTWNGRKLALPDGSVTYEIPTWKSYLAWPPVVGMLGGEVRVLARTHAGSLVSFAVDGGDRRVLCGKVPTINPARICDVDGDGNNEVLTTTEDENGHPIVLALDAEGKERLRLPWPTGTSETALGPVGSLGPDAGLWIAVRYRQPYKNARVVAYDGRTGAAIWTRDYLGPTCTAATKFVLHLPTGVLDADGDGADDLLASSENYFAVISVKDNRDIVPPMVITATVPGHWGAYAVPVAIPKLSAGTQRILHDKAYALTLVTDLAGKNIWHYGLTRDTTSRTLSGLADIDGDGQTEVVVTRQDGLLRAFDSVPAKEKCPTCPAAQPFTATNAAGKILWEYRLPPPVSDFASADLDGDGRGELLIGSGDGNLYALKQNGNQCALLWKRHLGRAVGSPVLADLTGDGVAEILVATADGRLTCLRTPAGNSARVGGRRRYHGR